MAANSTVKVTFLGDASNLSRAARQASDASDGVGAKMAKMAKVAGVAAVAAGAGFALVGKAAFSHGAELEAMANKASTVFGDQVGKVGEWAKANAAGMGLSSREVTGLAANFGDLLIPMGFTREEAAKMSTDVVGLSGALSQWSGGTVSAADASDILAKAMLGERDGLKSLGISISDADVEARLLKNGTDGLTGAALEQAKATATQQLIFEKSTDAQAAYKEGANKLLTAQNNLKSKLKEVYDEVSVRLIPVFTRLSTWVVDKGIPAVQELVARFRENVLPVLRDVGAFIRDTVVPAFQTVGEKMKELGEKVKGGAETIIRNWDAIKTGAQTAAALLSPIFAALAVHWAAVATAATVSAIKQAAAWVVTQVSAAKSAIVHGATVAAMVAGWVLVGTQALINGAKIAAGWVLALGPIGLGIIAFAAIATAIAFAWKKSETFRDIVKGAFTIALKAVDGFLLGIQKMLEALGKIPGFGWADTAAGKVAAARVAVDGLVSGLGKVKDKSATVTITTIERRVIESEKKRDAAAAGRNKARAKGGPVMAGQSYLVGEEGPEMIVPNRSGHVLTAKQTAAARSGAQVVNNLTVIGSLEASISERTIQETFRRMELLAGMT
jgi:hypothetical protein